MTKAEIEAIEYPRVRPSMWFGDDVSGDAVWSAYRDRRMHETRDALTPERLFPEFRDQTGAAAS